MGSIYKWALACFLFFFYQIAYNQCPSSRPITTTGGDTLVYLCPGGKKTEVSIRQFTYGVPFATVVTNTQNIALKVVNSSVIDLATLPEGEYRIYAYSYKGFLNNIIGKNIFTNQLTSYCYTQSSNFIKVIKTPPAAPVIDAQSLSPVFVCGPDQKFDSLTINAQFPTIQSRAYIVVNEENKIVLISESALINADPLECRVCKVYAAGYSGKLIAKKGDNLNVALADDCYAISKNFITLNHEIPFGGSIAINGQDENQFICADSKQDQFLSLSINSNRGGQLKYIVTDSNDRILDIRNEPVLSSASLQAGICKVYGLTFTGALAQNLEGKNVNNSLLSDDCYALTSNNVLIVKKRPFAGILSVLSGGSVFCHGDTISELIVEKKNVVSGLQKWIVASESGEIEQILENKLFPGSWSRGEKRIYNLSYTGNLLIKPGSKISDQATDDCYDLSKSYIPVLVDLPNPGILQFSNSAHNLFVCASDTSSLKIQFTHSEYNKFSQLYLLADEGGNLISVLDSNKIDLVQAKNGVYRLYGISFSGDLIYTLGQPVLAVRSDNCFILNTTFLSITKGEAKAGISQFENETDTLLVCIEFGDSKIKLKNKTSSVGKVQYIVTNTADTVLSIHPDSVDLKKIGIGIFKIRTLAYTDTFSLIAGSPVASITFEKGCIDLGATALIIIKDKAESGKIFLNEIDTNYQICAKDGWPDVLKLKNTSTSKFPYTYVLTDTSYTILALSASNFNLELLPVYNARLFGVSYAGKIITKVGEKLTASSFASGCAAVTDRFISLSGTEISAGTIRTSNNASQLFYCLDSKNADTMRLVNNGASGNSNYVYIGIQDDTIKWVSVNGVLVSSEIPAGTTQIVGLAYTGNFTGKTGDKVSAKRLVDSCYGVSTNSITIIKENPKAGVVKAGSDDKIYLCPGDGQSDYISFTNQGASLLSYAYLVVNEADTIIQVSYNSLIDFDSYPTGTCRVFGISYKGNLNVINKKINGSNLAEDCFDISQNYVSVIKSEANAGKITLQGGDTSIRFCVEDLGMDTAQFISSSTVKLNYALLVTNSQGRIIYILDDLNKNYDFNGYDPGSYRVYGLSYGGLLTAARNDEVKSASLATGCFDITENFIVLELSNTGTLCKNIGVNKENFAFLSVFPNPVHKTLRIRLKPTLLQSGKPEMALVSASGGVNKKIILDPQMAVNQDIEFDVHNLSPGLYFLLFKNGYIFDRIKVMIVR